MTSNILIYIEINDSKIETVSKEIISKIRSSFNDIKLCGAVIADENTISNVQEELSKLPLDCVYIINDNIFDEFQVCLYSKALCDLIKDVNPDIFLMGATPDGRDLAPRTASKLEIGLTADCTGLDIDSDGTLLATRPTYGGKLMATITSKTKPGFATIRPHSFKMMNVPNGNPMIEYKSYDISGIACLTEILNCFQKTVSEDWSCAEIIISGGLGLKTKENFQRIYKLADLINAKPAASRAAVELGWAPASIQVGQTGKSVSPKLYIAFGISGAMQHLVGISSSDKIIAVNTDRNAPIMKACDIAIVADAQNVLESLISNLS